ncbi:TM0106 family RecB-like putative nuclease [Candidatus Atribacteria bacterium 1244-E10-H5-B2]|nr:MAG: TM0106 family RecB-like putative nuclease [Candidatus Atribacteria bacterium 1244-E10-H5-B2]
MHRAHRRNSMPDKLSANMLYNYIKCPHRLNLDLFGDYSKQDPISSFVKLLWEKGTDFEKQVIENLQIPFLDLHSYLRIEKEKRTKEAINNGVELIYSGRISAGNLIGEPDLLRRSGDGYISGDIKSGSGLEGENDLSEGKPKLHYTVQLALYTDILERLGISAGRSPFIWDIHGREIEYNLNSPQSTRNPESWWTKYQNCLEAVSKIADHDLKTLPAYSGTCKLCHWRAYCFKCLRKANDLTLIPELGRSKRDVMINHLGSVAELAQANLNQFQKGKKTIFPRVGRGTLEKFQERAILLSKSGSKPYLKSQITLPDAQIELFFDIETDPMRDICYLHGFLERRNRDTNTERYIAFFSGQPDEQEEKLAFSQAWEFIQKSMPCVIYYYSPYERTQWRKLQEKYPEVMSEDDIVKMFNPECAVDLYFNVVKKKTEWPTNDYSIKTLASYLGFHWRDESPSGAESIEWYHRWVETGDVNIKTRILKYNEDDCIATRVLLDGICSLPLSK